jgi:hypothetical protein
MIIGGGSSVPRWPAIQTMSRATIIPLLLPAISRYAATSPKLLR